MSHGYREFKAYDGDRSGVIAAVIASFGAVRERPLRAGHALVLADSGAGNVLGAEFATFYLFGNLVRPAANDHAGILAGQV